MEQGMQFVSHMQEVEPAWGQLQQLGRPGSQTAVHLVAGHSATGCYVAGHSVAENVVWHWWHEQQVVWVFFFYAWCRQWQYRWLGWSQTAPKMKLTLPQQLQLCLHLEKGNLFRAELVITRLWLQLSLNSVLQFLCLCWIKHPHYQFALPIILL